MLQVVPFHKSSHIFMVHVAIDSAIYDVANCNVGISMPLFRGSSSTKVDIAIKYLPVALEPVSPSL